MLSLSNNLSLKIKLIFPCAGFGAYFIGGLATTWLQKFYVPTDKPVLIKPEIFGWIIFLTCLFDAITDPPVGFISDRYQSRLGRRRPFMLFSGIFVGLSIICLYYPPSPYHSTTNIIFALCFLLLFYLSYTFFFIPYIALLVDISKTKEERISLSAYYATFILIGGVAGTACPPVLAEVLTPYTSPDRAFPITATILSIFAVIIMYITSIFLNENHYVFKIENPSKLKNISIYESLSLCFKNKNFVYILILRNSCTCAMFILATSVPYYTDVLLKESDRVAALLYLLNTIFTLISIPLIKPVVKMLGEKNSYLFFNSLFIPGLIAIFFLDCHFWGEKLIINGIILFSFMGIPIAGLAVLTNVLIGKLVDAEYIEKGIRRESTYNSINLFFTKVAFGIGGFIANSILFEYWGYTKESPLGIKLTGIVSACIVFTGLVGFLGYKENLTEKSTSF